MLQTRRPHTKSRAGCLECKRRKIKCSEERPICSGCQKRNITCEYPRSASSPRGDNLRPILSSKPSPQTPSLNGSASASSHNLEEAPAGPSLTPGEASSTLAAPETIGHFNMEDMALWHHFVTHTAKTIGWAAEPESHHLSLTCDYVKHAVLSISAHHLACLNPDQRERFTYVAVQHQDLALGPFQAAISNITAENCQEVFAFSALLLVSIYASSRSPSFLLPASEVSSEFTNWITCLQGCRSIVVASAPYIQSGPLKRLMVRGTLEKRALAGMASPPDEDMQSLDKLANYLTNLPSIKSTTTVAEMEAYTEAIVLLKKILAATTQVNDSLSLRSLISLWPAEISGTFIRMLNECRPPALVILAHYSLVLKRCDSCWYLDHRAYILLDSVRQSLPEEWMPCIEQPMRVLKGQ